MSITKITAFASAALVSAGLATGSAQASLLVSEDFDYTAGSSIDGESGGSGWNGSWSDPWGQASNGSSVSSESLGDPSGNLATSGNSLAMTDGDQGARRNFDQIDSNDGDELWMSFLINPTSTGGEFAIFLIQAGYGQTHTYVGQNNGNYMLHGVNTGVSVASSPTALLLFKNDFNSGEQSLWVNPDVSKSEAELGSADATRTSDLSYLTGINPYARSGTAGEFDEIRIGTSYGDVAVVPEPASLALLGLGGALIAFRRRHA